MNKDLLNNIADYCFLGFFAVLPFVDILSPIVLGITLAMGVFFKSQQDFFRRLKENKGLVLLMLFFVLGLISLSYTSDFGKSLDKLSKILGYVLIPGTFLAINPSSELIKKAIKVFVYALIAFCVFSLFKLSYHFIVDYETSHWYNFVQDSMYHKHMPEDAMYLNTGLVFVLFGSFNRNFKLLVAMLFLVIIVLFGVRLGLFVYLLVVAAYFILNFKQLLTIRSLLIIAISIIASVALIQQSRYANDKFFDTLAKMGFDTSEQVSEVGENYHNINLRKKMWSSAVQLIAEKPIIGYGTGDEKNELSRVYQQRGYEIGRVNAHNQYLSLLIQYGMMGLVLLIVLFVYLIRKSILQKNEKIFLIVVIMIISMITESYLELQQGVFYFCTFVTLFVYQKENNNAVEN